jgi:predicted GH43/DUF377 family glycosyl hydrolase
MEWRKLGVVWCPTGDLWWARSHASCPTPLFLDDGTLRIYVQGRDEKGIGRIGFVDVDAGDPTRVLRVSPDPVLDVGVPGAFDDNGVFQTCVLARPDGTLAMYYVGFEICHQIRYRLLTGLAISHDGGETFQRLRATPVLERSPHELHIRGGPFVMAEGGVYRMWYVAGSEWETLEGKAMPVYDLHYLESADGVIWPEAGSRVFEMNRDVEHGFGRPYVVKKHDGYQMFYSVRKKQPLGYRMGYAESPDGRHWTRLDEQMGLDVSASGWDNETVEYAAVVNAGDKTFCFYNGNDFGVTGFGVAELIK